MRRIGMISNCSPGNGAEQFLDCRKRLPNVPFNANSPAVTAWLLFEVRNPKPSLRFSASSLQLTVR